MSRRTLFTPLVSSLTAILILAAGCSDQAPTGAELGSSYHAVALPEAGLVPSFSRSGSVSRVIGPDGGTIQADRITISFPAGAVSTPTEITVSPDTRNLGVTFGPHGIQFPAGHQPTASFSYQGIANLPEADLTIFYLSETGVALEKLAASVNTSAKTVSAQLRHFSEYTVATRNAALYSTRFPGQGRRLIRRPFG